LYNLFVTAQEGAWDAQGYEYDRGRFLEYTPDDVVASFKDLKSRQLDALQKLPCLFAYEGKEPMRVGKLNSIKLRGRALLIEFELDKDIPPIAYDAIFPIRTLLDIRDWEMNRTHWAVKDEDLFARLRSAGLLPQGTAQPPAPEARPDPEPAENQANSVGAFVTAVLTLKKKGKEVFYRGHSSKAKYRLEPSVFRKDAAGDYIHLDEEDRLYRELLVSNSSDFQGDVYSLDRLVRMQHYSLPTRLLDITSNPLIALYFACRSHGERREGGAVLAEEPGEVIVFFIDRDGIKYFDSDTASCLANLARLPRSQRDTVDYSLASPAFNKQQAVKRLLHFIKEEKPFFEPRIKKDDLRSVICVKGKRSNDRISFQSGAFLLFGHDAVLDELGTPQIEVTRIAVTGKARMLEELDQLGINERTVFPYIENSARYIAQKFAFRR
jgi:FRG domain